MFAFPVTSGGRHVELPPPERLFCFALLCFVLVFNCRGR